MSTNRNTQYAFLLACLTRCAFLVLPTTAAGYEVHLVDPPVTNHIILADHPLPPVCKPLRDVRLQACRGQYLPVSFIVTTTQPLEQVLVEADPVRNEKRQWAADAVDIHVVKDYYRDTIFGHNAAIPSILVHDDSFLAIEPAPTEKDPDRMANVARGPMRDTAALQPVDIEKRRQFWVTIHVPENARPDDYETSLRISAANGDATEFRITIEVHPFELLPPMIEYSIYYPTYLEAQHSDGDEWQFGNLSAQRMLTEFRNMRAHGLTNPNIYQEPKVMPDGSLDFTMLDRVLDLREQAGLRPKQLYLLRHTVPVVYRPLTEEQQRLTRTRVVAINEWARSRGYERVFLATHDEAWGENLSNERHSMIAIEEAGGATFVAVNYPTFFRRVGDALTRPVLMSGILNRLDRKRDSYSTRAGLRHMDEVAAAGSFTYIAENTRNRAAIDGMHRQGRKIFTYMNPMAGFPLPELHRRNTGLGMWRVGFDGTMTWAYAHIYSASKVNQPLIYSMVVRTEDGVLDALHYEGFREGVYDVQYLTTLLASLGEVAGRFPDDPLVDDTFAWLKRIDVATGDLDAIRREMAHRILALQDLGYKELTPREVFAGIDLDEIRLTSMPEPWKFKPDPDDVGIEGRWFDPNIDVSKWIDTRTDQDQGWDARHFDPNKASFGWYRAALPVAAGDLARKHKYLFVGAADEDSWVYVNGELIFDHTFETTGLIPFEIWMTSYTVDLSEVELRGGDPLVVRVKNTDGMGGLWKPVHLIATDQPLTHQQILALVRHRNPGAVP